MEVTAHVGDPGSRTARSGRPRRGRCWPGRWPMVSTGYRRAWSRPISVPSFWAKNVTGARPCAVSASRMARATSAGHAGQGPVEYRGVLPFDQPDRPDLVAERQVHLAELALDHLGRQQLVARRDRGDTLVTATPSACSPTCPRNRAMASVSRGERSRPSNSIPPSTITAPTETARTRSGVPAVHGPDAVGGGAADPDHREPAQVHAFQYGVGGVGGAQHDVGDPARGGVLLAIGERLSTRSMAATIPPVMSAVPGTLTLAMTRFGRCP